MPVLGETGTECQLCGCHKPTNTTVIVNPGSSFWCYLYHKNVRELLMSSFRDSEVDAAGEGKVPKLAFTFSLGGTTPYRLNENKENDEKAILCAACLDKLEELQTFDEQLESCKKLIARKLNQIENVCEGSASTYLEDFVARRDKKLKSLWRRAAEQGGRNVAMSGTIVGAENISQVLRCMGNLCEGMSGSQGNDRSLPDPEIARNVPQSESPNATTTMTTAEEVPGTSNGRSNLHRSTEETPPSLPGSTLQVYSPDAVKIAETTHCRSSTTGELTIKLEPIEPLPKEEVIDVNIDDATPEVHVSSRSSQQLQLESNADIGNTGIGIIARIESKSNDCVIECIEIEDDDQHECGSGVEEEPLRNMKEPQPSTSAAALFEHLPHVVVRRLSPNHLSGGNSGTSTSPAPVMGEGTNNRETRSSVVLTCHLCGEVMPPGKYQQHKKKHNGDAKDCGSEFQYKDSRGPTRERPFKCEICHRSFASKGNLNVHKRAGHPPTPVNGKRRKR